MRHLGLFEGIGGFMLAAEWMGWDHVAWVEKDEKAQLVLNKNFPNVKGYGDIKEFDGKKYRGQVDIITGGFPCQPFSVAGKRQGVNDERYLWEEMLRVIREVKPTYVVGENVFGLLSMENGDTFERICFDLESEGYTVESFVIPACAVQAWHRRDRIWILAYSKEKFCYVSKPKLGFNSQSQVQKFRNCDKSIHPNYRKERRQRREYQPIPTLERIQRGEDGRIYAHLEGRPDLLTPVLCRTDDGVSERVERTGQFGNAVVPQLVYEIFNVIQQLDDQRRPKETV